MNRLWFFAATTLLLGACTQAPAPALPDTATPDAPAPPAAVDASPPATSPAPADMAAATAAPITSSADAPSDTDATVNAAIDAALGDHTRYQPVIAGLQAAVAAGDGAAVARLAHYPFGVSIGGKDVVLRNEKEFVSRYPEFMTPDIRDAIVGTKYADLFVNYKGVMFGSGQAWINGICKDDACKDFDVKLVTLQPGPQ
jgi:hypothetical protein